MRPRRLAVVLDALTQAAELVHLVLVKVGLAHRAQRRRRVERPRLDRRRVHRAHPPQRHVDEFGVYIERLDVDVGRRLARPRDGATRARRERRQPRRI